LKKNVENQATILSIGMIIPYISMLLSTTCPYNFTVYNYQNPLKHKFIDYGD